MPLPLVATAPRPDPESSAPVVVRKRLHPRSESATAGEVPVQDHALCAKLSRRTLRVASGGGKALLCHGAHLTTGRIRNCNRRLPAAGGSTSVGVDQLHWYCAGESKGCKKKNRRCPVVQMTPVAPRVARARPHSVRLRPMSGVKAALDKLSEPLRGGAMGCALGLGSCDK